MIEALMIIGITSGYAGGMLLGIFLSRKFVQAYSKERFTYIAGLTGCYLSLIPAVFIATIIGGTPGGGFGELLFGKFGIPFGLSLGLASITTLVVFCASAFGLLLGKVMYELFAKYRAT
ncbi:MAG: hypothetical protein JAY99_01730 [Candidatus Thiodiazotropha lotti]|nr:hypothetical protein [Candidatus Thiodiazotropha lotti]MCG7998222.1 hypothetical protein [Candidatus Thiodiazotropha lotti]MCW4182851.1 hypothetical protein [Candidatus Thiodiazotropha weberae]MCW4189988.1 hypothetical protein [Candidatus Thiodiazotropha weberae]